MDAVADKEIRKELHAACDNAAMNHREIAARKQLMDKLLACCSRSVGLHDNVNTLGNEIRDLNKENNGVIDQVNWCQERIDFEQKEKEKNTIIRDQLLAELEEENETAKRFDR